MIEVEFLFKLTLCILQFVCMYQVLKHDRGWLLLLQMLMLCVSMSI